MNPPRKDVDQDVLKLRSALRTGNPETRLSEKQLECVKARFGEVDFRKVPDFDHWMTIYFAEFMEKIAIEHPMQTDDPEPKKGGARQPGYSKPATRASRQTKQVEKAVLELEQQLGELEDPAVNWL